MNNCTGSEFVSFQVNNVDSRSCTHFFILPSTFLDHFSFNHQVPVTCLSFKFPSTPFSFYISHPFHFIPLFITMSGHHTQASVSKRSGLTCAQATTTAAVMGLGASTTTNSNPTNPSVPDANEPGEKHFQGQRTRSCSHILHRRAGRHSRTGVFAAATFQGQSAGQKG